MEWTEYAKTKPEEPGKYAVVVEKPGFTSTVYIDEWLMKGNPVLPDEVNGYFRNERFYGKVRAWIKLPAYEGNEKE